MSVAVGSGDGDGDDGAASAITTAAPLTKKLSRLRLALSPNSKTYQNYLEEARKERLQWIDSEPVQARPPIIGFDGHVDNL